MDTKREVGVGGNPGGRPKGHGDARELAQQHAKKAVATLVEIVNDQAAAALARAAAASALLDRAGEGRSSRFQR